MGKLDDIVPVETTKETFRSGPDFDAQRSSLREVMESHASELDDEPEVPSDNLAHAPQRSRDERGRFAKSQGDEPEETSEPAAPTPREELKTNFEALQSGEVKTIETPQETVAQPASPSSPVLVPQSWAADAKGTWNQIPPRAQAEIVKRENDLRRGLQQATDQAKQVQQTWSEVEQVLEPFKNQWARNGVRPGQVISQMLAWQNHLDNEQTRAQAFHQLAQSYGTTLAELAQVETQQPQVPSYVRDIQRQNQELMQMFEHQKQQALQSQQQSVVSEVQAFAEETDASGNKLRPHLEYIMDDMMAFLPAVKAANPQMAPRQWLQAAYEKAIWANPSTRELEMKRAQQSQVSPQKLERARRAAKMVNGEAMSPEVEEVPRTVGGALRAAAQKLNL